MAGPPKSAFQFSLEKRSLLERLRREEGLDAGVGGGIERDGHEGAAPLSFAQQRLWFMDQVEPGNPLYNLAGAVRLRGSLDVPALERALGEILRRHEALRTRYFVAAGEPLQEALPPGPFPLARADLTSFPSEAREERALALASEETRKPFDLSRGPLTRGVLYRLDDEDHVLAIATHHIATDGWSTSIFMKELSSLYRAAVEREPFSLPELPIQYSDFARWQRRHLSGEALTRLLDFWKGQLGPDLADLDLPTDHPRPRTKRYLGGRVDFELEGSLATSLNALAQQNAGSLFMVLLAAFKVLLFRYTGQSDVTVGTAIANRNRVEVEPLIGFFVNTLAMRTDLSGNPTFVELLSKVRQTVLAADAHQDLPFEKLVEEIAPDRDLGRNPFFQVVFDLQRAPRGRFSLAGLDWSGLPLEMGTTRFDLELHLVEGGDRLPGFFRYDSDLFERETVARLARHYVRLLESVAATPEGKISSLPLLDGFEREEILVRWNRTSVSRPDVPVHELFERQARLRPEAPAVSWEGGVLRYRELDSESNRLAHHLRKLGVGIESRVGVCLERSPELLVALLAVLKTGGAYVPLDPGYPEERLRFMLADSGLAALVTDSTAGEKLEGAPVPRVSLDRDREAISREDPSSPAAGVTPSNLAYVTYTSGSSGVPKGVEVLHRGIVRLLHGVDYVRLGPKETILQMAPVPFDASTFEIWGSLLHGGKLVLYPGRLPETAELARILTREKVTTLWLTSSLFNAVVDDSPEALSGVTQVLVGGEALSVPHIERAQRSLPGTTLVNGYGPTESTTFACCHPISELNGREVRSIPIGRPIANTKAYLLDPEGSPVPVGVVGELHIGGEGLARGYSGRPELTADAFVPDAFGPPGGRLYRTGDLARYLPGGDIEFLGRADHQVKVRGYRVELAEIEAALASHPGVAGAVVVAQDSSETGRSLAAYYVSERTSGGPPPSSSDLRSFLEVRLPEYMIPSRFALREELPLLPSGKIDRRALAELSPREDLDFRAGGDARSPVEEGMAEIWATTLEVDRVGVHESFFALGGHSLAAVRMLARVREVFQVDLPLRAVFESDTVAALSRRVELARGAADPASIPPLGPAPGGEPRPLSFAQRRLWLLDRLAPGSASYNVAGGGRLRGPLRRHALSRALKAVVERHEALRTTFDEDGPYLRIGSPDAFELPEVDLSLSADPDSEARRIAEEQARAPMDLARGPLFRCLLLRLRADEHWLIWTMHHVATDAWSIGIFHRELGALYRGYSRGEEVRLPALSLQYGDFSTWQRKSLEGDALERQLSYWRRELSGEIPAAGFPPDRSHPERRSYRGLRSARPLSLALCERLREFSRREGVTSFMTLLAVFELLLSRYTGQKDFLLGTPVANRSREAIEGIIGLFVDTLVLRADLSSNPTFQDLVSRVREKALSAFSHQDVPFERLVAELARERHGDRNPLFQVAFALQSAGSAGLELEGLSATPLELSMTTSRFDFELHVWESSSRMGLVASYDSDLFEESTVARILEHYENLLESALAEPGASVDALSLLGEAERARILSWSRASADTPRDETLDRLFGERVRETPEAVAVSFGEERLSYRELDRRADALARRLLARGVGAEDRVGVFGERSVDLYTAVLAVIKAGGAYVPLDPAYPGDRLDFMIRDADVRAILAASSSSNRLPRTGVPTLCWDESDEALEQGAPLRGAPSAGSLAYVIYTSGSTGVPKGVGVTHRAILRLVRSTNYIELTRQDRVAQAASFSFDAATFELWGALLAGARVVGIEKDLSLEPEAFGRELREKEVSVLFLTTALFNVMVRRAPDALGALRCLLFGGEAVDTSSVRTLLESAPPRRLLHVYGPTESTTFASYSEVTDVPSGARTVPIGRPIANTELYVLDENRELCPIGVPGELHIGGDGLARGYWNRAELTAERFVPHPWGRAGERLYRTGDVVRRLSTGELEFLGREDGQVKLRGHRVELGEVEAALRSEDRVRDAAVLVRDDDGDKQLVGYVVLAEGAESSAFELRRRLLERLPEYMVPQFLVELSSIPLTPNGKVDRRALPDPANSGFGGENDGYVPPRGPLEEELARLVRQVLGIDRVGVHDNFFHLGGHSLLATELVSRVRKIFRVSVPLRDFFSSPSIASLARALQASGDGAGSDDAEFEIPRLPRTKESLELPLSFAQRRLWFLAQVDPGSAAYNMATAVRLEGDLDVPALSLALETIFERHEALRSVFGETDGTPHVRLVPPSAFAVSLVELEGVKEHEREREVLREVAREALRPFDARGPLMRCRILRLSGRDHVLQIVLDHRIADGWSLGVLFRELGILYRHYRGNQRGRPTSLPELEIQYADFAAWQREWLSGEVRERQLAYWREALPSDLTPLDLPTDYPRPPVRSSRGGRVSRTLDGPLAGALSEFARAENVTPFMVLLAGFDAFLHRYTGQDDVVVGTTIANRNRVEIEPLIGFFANSLVLRANLASDPTFRELVSRVRDVCLGAYAHQDLPFEVLVEEREPERDLSQNPLFQVTFALQSARIELSLDGLRWRPVNQDIRTTRFDLEVNVWESAKGLEIVAYYSTDLFRRTTVERMLGHLERLLEGALAAPALLVSELPLLSEPERRELITEGNPLLAPALSFRSIAEVFQERVEAHPNAVALVCGEERLTYAELDRMANQLAHHLLALGVGPEARVGVFLPRSILMVVALLATLKAGGAYVPLDSEYPEERISFMLRDSRARVVLTVSELASRLPATEAMVVRLDAREARARIEEMSEDRPSRTASAASLAYVIYTSGSTGVPKGVEVSHRGVLRLVADATYVRLGPSTTILQLAPISFDASTFEIWGALLTGGRLALYPERVPTAEELGRALSDLEVTTLWLTASLFNAVLDELPSALRPVKELLVGGEALSVLHVSRALAMLPETTLVNGYGPTEGTTFTCCYRIPREGVGELRSIPIGGPIGNTTVYVLDSAMNPVPRGASGELYIGGHGLARGYQDRPELTAEKFVPDPFSESAGARLYRTGDLVRRLPDASIVYLGRRDQQVKVRGFRIELEEVGTVLRAHPDVATAAVVLLDDGAGQKRLSGFVVWKGTGSSLDELRSYVKTKLPGYMVPASLVAIDALPLTPNGKLDREKLAALEPAPGGVREIVLPRTPIEEILAIHWAQVLRVAEVSVRDNFFEVGGHSLLATQLVSRIRKAFRIDFPLRAVFESPTIAELASTVASIQGSGDLAGAGPIPRVSDARGALSLPLSFSQQRLWFFDQLDPGSTAYNMPFALRMSGPVDYNTLERSFATIIGRHQVLRCVFDSVDGRPVIRELPLSAFRFRRIDLTGLPEPDRRSEGRRLAEAEARRPFTLARGPLVRHAVVKLGEEEHLLLLTLHHIVADGWSLVVLFHELDELSRAHDAGKPSPLEPLSIQYPDFAHWQREWLQEGVLARQLEYWRTTLSGAPSFLPLPTDWPRPAIQTFRGGRASLKLTGELYRSLLALSHGEGATLFMTVLAAFQVLLARHSGQEDVVVGTPIAGRNRGEVEPLIGFFVNTLVLRTSLGGNPRFRDLLSRVRESALGAYAHQDLPFDRLVEELAPVRDLSRTPLFQVMFNFLNLGGTRMKLSSVSVEAPPHVEPESKFDLTLYAGERDETLQLTMVYNADLFRRARIEEMLAQIEAILAAVAKNPDQPVGSISLVTEGAKGLLPDPERELALLWSRAAHERFQERARTNPERTAVADDGHSWTYGELERASNRLAGHLRARGVGEEDVVAIYAQRSASLPWALLGVWKAGAAFVVLDCAYPESRLVEVVRQARPRGALHLRAAGAAGPELQKELAALDFDLELPASLAEAPLLDSYSEGALEERVPPERRAYISFTSGSTGIPKGIVGTHRPLAHFLDWHTDRFELDETDRFAMTAGLSHDPLLRDVFTPLAIGARLDVPSPDTLRQGRLSEWMRERATTVLHLTPSLTQLLDTGGESASLPALRRVFFGGEPLTGADVRKMRERAPGATTVNYYGTTETPQAMGHFVVEPDRNLDERFRVPLGSGVQDAQLLVLTDSGQLAGVGELGEICVRTPYLSQGYLDDLVLTRERFPIAALGPSGSSGLYRTGDLGRYLPDGNVDLAGRADHQIKLRGHRIELGEIESVLRRHPGVRESAVLCREDEKQDRRLVAYVVAPEGSETLKRELGRHLSRVLPDYMVPTEIVCLPVLPLTPNGKVDRRALPAPEGAGHPRERVSPRTPVEAEVFAIWEGLLAVPGISIDDNFFRLGGHSLLATRVISRIRDAFDVEIPLRVLFENPTIEDLAAAVTEALLAASDGDEMREMLRELDSLPSSPERTER